MRFYVPESDDSVDGGFDFEHDEFSRIHTKERDLAFIWDIFGRADTPIDGILISRDQVEDSPSKLERFTSHGVHNEGSELEIPDWLPTISDCGAWGYKSLPFPPYGNEEMLQFYENLGVSIGVTIDHPVFGSGKDSRLYLDERALEEADVAEDEITESLEDQVDDILIEEWPDKWPSNVGEYESGIRIEKEEVEPFEKGDFRGTPQQIIDRLDEDTRAVYRENDSRFRYRLTLENAQEMKDLYEENGYSFRLMAAIQGWDPVSYANATEQVLDHGHEYIGIGGMANSKADVVRETVTAIANVVKAHERRHTTRIDTHIFGFAKTQAFDAIGATGMTSFDSASMLRSAWEGGANYHLNDGRKYHAIRVRPANYQDSDEEKIEKVLRGQELLHALRAFDRGTSMAEAIENWRKEARDSISNLGTFLQNHRHDEIFDQRLIREVETAFRESYEYGYELNTSLSRKFRKEFVKLLRDDDPDDPIEFNKYQSLIDTVLEVFHETPSHIDRVREMEESQGKMATYDQIEWLLENYTEWIGDEDDLDSYKETLKDEPWRDCHCSICRDLGVEVVVFRGNNRNRRRGFHNTYQFYQQFTKSLPKSLVAVPADDSMQEYLRVEEHLKEEKAEFWSQVHDLPVAEVGELSQHGICEWWQTPPPSRQSIPETMAELLAKECSRYQGLYLFDPEDSLDSEVMEAIERNGCSVQRFSSPKELRVSILDRLGFSEDFLPEFQVQKELVEFTP